MEELKICQRGFEIMALCAFRYAMSRHFTQSMIRGFGNGDTIENIIMDNLDHINDNYKNQMMCDICLEIELYDNLDGADMGGYKIVDTKPYPSYRYSPHYLERLLDALKDDYAKNHDGVEWQKRFN